MSAAARPPLAKLEADLPLRRAPWDRPLGDEDFPEAGVLVALTDEAQPRVVLGRRAMHLFHHPGEVAFAGGKREARDDSPWATALREAREEVGLPESLPRPIGELAPLITRTGFKVHPCVAVVPAQPRLASASRQRRTVWSVEHVANELGEALAALGKLSAATSPSWP